MEEINWASIHTKDTLEYEAIFLDLLREDELHFGPQLHHLDKLGEGVLDGCR